jgi:hypothetical protein
MEELLVNMLVLVISGIFCWSFIRYLEDEKNKKK